MNDELLVRDGGAALGVSARLVARKYGWFVAMNHEKKTHERCGIFQGGYHRARGTQVQRETSAMHSRSLFLCDRVQGYFSVIAIGME